MTRTARLTTQVCIVLVAGLLWQFLPQWPAARETFTFLNPFFISSPTEVYRWLVMLATGDGTVAIWPFLRTTLTAAILGAIIGVVGGMLAGLVFSESEILSDVGRPFIVLANTVPRIALIPVVVVILGPTIVASTLTVALVCFFLSFFNAFEGGTQVRKSVLDNATLLGANRLTRMIHIRAPYVLLWTLAIIPAAISFGILVAVTAELLTGLPGMGAMLLTATSQLQSGLTFAIIVILAFTGVILYNIAEIFHRAVASRME